MKKNILIPLLFLLGSSIYLQAASLSDTLDTPEAKSTLIDDEDIQMPLFNNRILTRVNGEPISLFDVIKKMDFVFFQQFPQYATSKQARVQFYQMHWRSFLDNVIEEKLLLADAEEKKLTVRDGEVREELERLFGPNVIENIDTAGLTFADAWEMVRNHLTVQRMSYIAVHMKTSKKVSPEAIKLYYENNIDQFMNPVEWEYRVISIKSDDELECNYLANYAFEKIIDQNDVDDDLKASLEEKASLAKVNVSSTYKRKEHEISTTHLDHLKKLNPGQCSPPIEYGAQNASQDQKFNQRIFYLKDVTPSEKIPLSKVEELISETMLNEESATASEAYLNELRARFGIDKNGLKENIPDDYKPFAL